MLEHLKYAERYFNYFCFLFFTVNPRTIYLQELQQNTYTNFYKKTYFFRWQKRFKMMYDLMYIPTYTNYPYYKHFLLVDQLSIK